MTFLTGDKIEFSRASLEDEVRSEMRDDEIAVAVRVIRELNFSPLRFWIETWRARIMGNDVATAALEKARKEIESENLKEAIEEFKMKLRELERARVIVANIEREIKELELKVAQGN